jgi:hypothetical protein
MHAMTTQEASNDLYGLIDRVIAHVEPTIICNNKGNKAILISLEEFSHAKKHCIYCQLLLIQSIFLPQLNQQKEVRLLREP